MFVFIKHPVTFVEYPVCHNKILHTSNFVFFNFVSFADVGYNMYKKNYVAPKQSEGLDEIIDIEFVPKFDSEVQEKFFHYYTES
jgi:hypothetical protein